MFDTGFGRVVGQRGWNRDLGEDGGDKEQCAATALVVDLPGGGLCKVERAPQGHIQGLSHSFE